MDERSITDDGKQDVATPAEAALSKKMEGGEGVLAWGGVWVGPAGGETS